VQTPTLPRRTRGRPGNKCLAVVALCFLTRVVDAAEPALTTILDTTHATLGDPLHLRLVVDRDADEQTLFPDLVDVAPFEVRSATEPRSTSIGAGRQRDERVYELRVFTLEAEQIPAVEVPVVTAAGDTVRLLSEALPITIEPVRDPAEGDELRAIKPPLTIAGGVPLWLAGMLAALLAAGIAFLAWRFLRPAPAEPPIVVASPRGPVDYIREFSRIADMGLLERGATKVYYTHLADVMRRFLEDRAGVDALERTTAEIASDLPVAERVDAESVRRIVEFLEAADLVKFARAEPTNGVARQAPDIGADIVRDVENLLREREAAARLYEAPVDVKA
jgi:hypothetical protein